MGVRWLTCDCCGNNFPDCGSFVSCGDDCSKVWCDDECAEKDGFTYAKCKLDLDLSREGFLEDDYSKCPRAINKSSNEWIDCDGCENYTLTSCKYCRHEEYEDSELLEKAMELLNCDRQFLINKIKEE